MPTMQAPEDLQKEEMLRRNQEVSPLQAGPTTGFLERMQQSFERAWWAGNINSRMHTKTYRYRRLGTKAEKVLGEKVPNPLDPGWSFSDPNLITRSGRFSGGIPLIDTGIPVEEENKVDEFFKKMEEAYKKTGNEIFNTNRSEFEINVGESMAESVEEYRKTIARYGGPGYGAGMVSDMAGALPAVLTDPWDIGTLPIGATASTSVLGSKVLGTALVEAGIEVGVEALQQPDVQDMRQKAGLRTNTSQSILNVAAAGIGGGSLGAGAKYLDIKVKDYIEALNNQRKAKEVTKQLVKRNIPITEVDTARRVLEMNDYARRTNPFSDKAYGEGTTNFGIHLSNMKQAQRSVLEGKTPDVDESVEYESKGAINRNTQKVPVERIDTSKRATTLNEPEGNVRPLFFETEDGTLKVIEGTDKIATGMQRNLDEIEGTIIKESDGITEDMAEKFALGKRYEQGIISRKELEKAVGKEQSELMVPEKSQFVHDGKAIRDELSDEGFLKFKTDENVDFHVAAKVAREVDETDQVKALELTKDAKTKDEAQTLIDLAKEEGYENIDPLEEIGRRKQILNDALQKMQRNNDTITLSNGSEVAVNDEFIAGLRQLSERSEGLSETINRLSKASGGSGKPETPESASSELLSIIEEKIRSGDISGDAIREAKSIARSRRESQQLAYTRNITEDIESSDIEEKIHNGELREMEEYREIIEENDLEDMKIPSFREDEEKTTVKQAMDSVDNDKETLEKLRECAV